MVSEICDPQSLDPICGKFDKFSAHGQAHMGQMGKWAWQCTTTGLDNSIELRTEKIHQAVTEIWVPQVWQPPARPPAHPPARPSARTVTTIPLQPGGLRGKKVWQTDRQTDRRTDGQTENTICRAAWSQLKTIGHLFYATSSFVQHFVAIGEFKLELQSGNAQSGSKSTIFFSRVTLKFDGWPSKTIGHLS